jgi:hypothetical protein
MILRKFVGYVIAEAARHWLLTKETHVQSWVTSSKIYGGQSGTGTGFS